ncbi:isochorismate synthase [Paraconexibacter algicola]|uniref:isochorismate synthase n=1 Tax=Paraconexibacter algicola TaxID=2133960 RepID=A0A2T4UBB6_9ACTN|nr:isochorismate synthase [Paraconexibacter algicola]PTL54147.1 isochorismate synthase [Paraconexibacter algicola]
MRTVLGHTATDTDASPFLPAPGDRARLQHHLEIAGRRARTVRSGAVLAAATWALPPDVDPTGTVVASRRSGEPWFVFEQPDRDGAALTALGCAVALEAHGEDRFAAVAARWRRLAADAVCDPRGDGPRGSGPVAVGGFSFAPDGGRAPHWEGFAPASLQVPEVAIVRRGGDLRLTVTALVHADDDVADVLARLDARLRELRDAPPPVLDPSPVSRTRVASTMPPEHYEGAVQRAVERIRAGRLQKVVLAREVQVHTGPGAAPHDPGGVLGVLRDAFPSCYIVCAGRGDSAFLAASPELLIQRDGLRAGTLALAGSTRRSADPAVDDHLGEALLRSTKDREEQAIVTRRIERTLAPHSVWVTSAEEPIVVKVANIQHLGTPIRAQLASHVGVIELAGLLHPTPAVGGEPLPVAAPMIPELEGFDRGWYAGPVGWADTGEDGEFCVALRSALLTGGVARCFAGVGVVRDSDPAAELAETEIKLQALLPVLAL